MIAKDKMLRKVCRNYEQVENYERAVADEELWDLHHRRETDEMKSAKQLQEEGRYFDVAPEELIFLTHREHAELHGKFVLAETRNRYKLRVGEKNAFYGKHHSAESLKKISEIKKSKELHWWNDGKTSKLSKEQPGPDFVRGRLK